MGALADYSTYLSALRSNRGLDFQAVTTVGRTARMAALWRGFVPTPATPTASVALDRTSDVAIGPIPTVSGSDRVTLLGGRINPSATGAAIILADILNHSGGLSGTLTTTQTTNLPTAPLTRYTSGEGVMAGLIIYTVIGTTATTFTVSYTNSSLVSGRTSTATQIGATGFRELSGVIPIPLQAGDTGVVSVESVTLAGSTTTAGNFGVVLFKPLAMIACNDLNGAHVIDSVSSGGFVGSLAKAEPDACLSVLAVMPTTQLVSGSILFAEV